MKHTCYFAYSVFLLLIFLTTGCSDKVCLSGKVIFSDNTPLMVGTVCFEKDGFLARGEIGKDGTFTVGSVSSTDGLPPGTYRVYIIDADEEVGKDKAGMPEMKHLIDLNKLNGTNSPVSIEISSKTKKLELTVERPTDK